MVNECRGIKWTLGWAKRSMSIRRRYVTQISPATYVTHARSTPACDPSKTTVDCVSDKKSSMSQMPFCSPNAAPSVSQMFIHLKSSVKH